MRWFNLTLSSLTLALVFCTPALAQSSPAAFQYDPGSFGSCPPGSDVLCAQSVTDGVEDIAGNAEQGTAAVNEAMNDAVEGPAAGTSESAASASPEAALSSETAASPQAALSSGTVLSPESASAPGPDAEEDVAITYDGESSASIKVLPETGGAPLLGLCAGVCLLGCGLLLVRLAFV